MHPLNQRKVLPFSSVMFLFYKSGVLAAYVPLGYFTEYLPISLQSKYQVNPTEEKKSASIICLCRDLNLSLLLCLQLGHTRVKLFCLEQIG